MEQGKIIEAEVPTVRVGANPIGLTAPPTTPPCVTRGSKVFYRPDALPAAQPTTSKHWRQKHLHANKYKTRCRLSEKFASAWLELVMACDEWLYALCPRIQITDRQTDRPINTAIIGNISLHLTHSMQPKNIKLIKITKLFRGQIAIFLGRCIHN